MTIQSDVYTIILETILMGIAIIALSKKFDKADPMAKPKGILTPVLWAVETVHKTCRDNVGEKTAEKLTPYVLVLWAYIFISNIISLFGLSSPTSNLSVTLLLAFLTWLMIQVVELKYQGIGGYLHGFLEPIPVMLPMNIFGKFSTMVSMSLRLFGNILCGGIMMQLIYSFCQWISTSLVSLITGGVSGTVFNFVAPLVAPLLHAYFDLFAGFIQTLVFVTLTIVLIGNDIPDEAKEA